MDVVLPILAIFFVIGLLAGLLLFARRAANSKPLSLGSINSRRLFFFPLRSGGPSEDQASLHIVKQLSLTPSHRVHLLQVSGKNLLLCTHPHGCTLIQEDGHPIARAGQQESELHETSKQTDNRHSNRVVHAGERSVG